MPRIKFTKTVVGHLENPKGPGEMNTFHTVADLNGDGRPDIAISGRHGEMAWFENPGKRVPELWKKHRIDDAIAMECGGSAKDLTGSGLNDIINGSEGSQDKVFWWENPGANSDEEWVKRLIITTGKTQIHDTIIGDVTGDGKESLVFTNQHGGTTVTVIPLPSDPRVSPWPDAVVIARDLMEDNPGNTYSGGKQPEEGLAIGDIDGDGLNELVAGTHWFKYRDGSWEMHKFAKGYITCKCYIADVDGDGRNVIILSEGDPLVYGKMQGGKLGWFKPGADITEMWDEHVLDEGLYDPHTLQCADLFGSGNIDLVVGEVGGEGRQPIIAVYRNLGDGAFEKQIIDEGTGIHEALLVDMDGDGGLDIVGKPLKGAEKWDIHVYYNEGLVD